MKLLDLLYESLTDTVYHFTITDKLIKILQNDAMNFSTALGSKEDLKNRGKYNFLSFTRSKMSGFSDGNVKIVFDGRKLNQKYKSIPFDFYQEEKNDKQIYFSYINALNSLEQEDRIISNDLEIPNVSKYIKEIHIFDEAAIYKPNYLGWIFYKTQEKNIPLYIYYNKKNFLKQIKPLDWLTFKQNPDYKVNQYDNDVFNYELAAFVAYNNEDAYQKIIDYLKYPDLYDKFINSINYKKKFTYHNSEFLVQIMIIINDMRKKMTKSDKFLMKLLIKDMSKYKTKNLEEYLKAKQN
jgi:tetratricopeptide (TPR) repeat protein